LLFADLSGFTTLSEKMDPEDVKALAHRCTGRLSAEVPRFGGTVLAIAGDQVVAAFGAPVAHEDDAERAVRAALAMRDCPLRDGNGKPIKVHAGVNTGEVMAGLIGPQEHQDYAVMGDTTNVAARLMSAAPAGSVLVGEETWRATRRVIKYRELPPVLAKGKQQPVQVWEALETLAAPRSRPLGTAPLVGRDEELGLLSGTWLRVVRESRPHLVSVLGDPGLGKSRLVAEFEKRFCKDALVLHGRCLPYGQALGYWALTTALKEAAGITAESDVATAREQLRQLTRRVFTTDGESETSEIGRHLALLSGLDCAEDRSGNAVDQRALHGSVRRFMEALAGQQPLCWMVEDIQWADDTLLDLIEFVATRAKEAPLLILTQARPDLLDKRPTWGAGVRAFTSLPLEPLSAAHGRELVLALCRERGLAEKVADQVGRGAGGNPLFAEELIAMIAERGTDAGVPSAIKVLIAARLDALPVEQRQVLQVAAVVGKSFWVGTLRALGADATVSEHLERLEQVDLLRAQPRSEFRGEREFAFKHDLIRDVAYEMLPRVDRKTYHGRVADWLEQAAGSGAELYFDQLAHHALHAGQEERALGYLSRAAERAQRAGAHREEAALLAQAISMAEHLEESELAAKLRVRRGNAFFNLSMWMEARSDFEAALPGLGAATQDQRAQMLLNLAIVCNWQFDTPKVLGYATEAMRLAEEIARDDLAGQAIALLGNCEISSARYREARAVYRQALARCGSMLGTAFAFAPHASYLVGEYSEAVELGRRFVDAAQPTNNTYAKVLGLSHLGLALTASGQYAEAAGVFREAIDFGRERDVRALVARSLAMSACAHLDLFDFARAEALSEQARDLGRSASYQPPVLSASIDLALNFVRRQEVVRAQQMVDGMADEIARAMGSHEWLWKVRLAEARAEIHLVRREFQDAIHCAGSVVEQSLAGGRRKYQALGLSIRAQAVQGLGRAKEGLADLRAAVELARTLGDPALFLRVAIPLLALDGDDELLAAARSTAKRIAQALPDAELRHCFESAEPVQRWQLLAA
jgi:class 3 adenylate cyclase/tetratricopeptide (TPR) repeat protein